MADENDETERQAALERFRMMREETTDPLAARLIGDIINELEAGTKAAPKPGPRD